MRILFTSRAGGTAGSTESITYLARGLAQRGHEVHLATPAHTNYWQNLEEDPVTLHEVSFRKKWDRSSILRLIDIIRRGRIQIVNAQSSYDRYVGMLARALSSFPARLVHTRRQRMNSSGGALQRWWYLRATDGFIAVSEGVKRSMLQKGIPESAIQVIYNGTPSYKYQAWDPDRTEILRRELQIAPDERVIGSVSRPKRQGQIIRAALRLQEPIRLVFVGLSYQEAQRRYPEALRVAQSAGLKMHFMASVSLREALAWMKLLDVHILSSITEGLSQSLLEAMYMGVPNVATRAAGNPDLIRHEHNGLLFEDEDIDGLAREIHRLLQDDNLRKKMIQAGLTTARDVFSMERTLDAYESYFYGLLGIQAKGRSV